jgi:hypothetical protein
VEYSEASMIKGEMCQMLLDSALCLNMFDFTIQLTVYHVMNLNTFQ